jgi:hypothetical protein
VTTTLENYSAQRSVFPFPSDAMEYSLSMVGSTWQEDNHIELLKRVIAIHEPCDAVAFQGDKPIWIIYSLSDPRGGPVQYVGVTFNMSQRYDAHISSARARQQRVSVWMTSLLDEGIKPQWQTLEVGCGKWAIAEKKWVAHFKEINPDLKNMTLGGAGTPRRYTSPEHCKRISEAKKGKPWTAETRERMKFAKKPAPPSRETVMKRADKLRGRTVSQEQREQIRATLTGRKRPPEISAKANATKLAKCPNIDGHTFGLLTILRLATPQESSHVSYMCLCKCNSLVIVNRHRLISGHTKSCGCLKRKPKTESEPR